MAIFNAQLPFHEIALRSILLLSVLLLASCEMIGSRPDDIPAQKKPEKKAVMPDISRLTLEEVHNLPANKECRALLSRAEEIMKSRPTVSVKVKGIEGQPEGISLDEMFYLDSSVETYPQDESIRSYKCPKNIKDVKVTYRIAKGPGYKKRYYFSYNGKYKDIDTSSPIEPKGIIKSRIGDEPPSITLKLDKIKIISLRPLSIFANDELSFRLNNIVLDKEKYISFHFFNKSEKDLAIRKLEVILGPDAYQVDFKDNIVTLTPNQLYKMNKVRAGALNKRWFVSNGNKAVRLLFKVIYKADRKIKNLTEERYIRLKDLGINMK